MVPGGELQPVHRGQRGREQGCLERGRRLGVLLVHARVVNREGGAATELEQMDEAHGVKGLCAAENEDAERTRLGYERQDDDVGPLTRHRHGER